jgi:protein SDA1
MASLPLLQSQIRRDPEGYEQEYRIQFRSFETTAQTFHVTPGRPHKHFQELVSFIAHVYTCYPKLREELNFPQIIFSTLRKEPERIHPSARKVMVAAVLSLLRRDAVSLMAIMQELFKLFGIEDKELRSLLHGRLLSEISSRTTSVAGKKKKKGVSGGSMTVVHVPPSELKKRLQDFLMKFINSGKSCPELVLRAVASLVCALYKRKDWVDEFTINSMLVTLCKAEDAKVSSAAMHVFLGESWFAAAMLELGQDQSTDSNKKNKSAVESDDETGGKKKIKKSDQMSGCDFAAIDMLIEPYSFTEDILKRAMNNTDRTSFEYRLLALRLVCRLVYRKELVVPNLYPFLEKYLYPSNRHVTKVLACLAQACHANVPPEEMQSVVRHVLNQFVSDHCRPEVITVGMNALRGICERAPLALTKDQLMDLVQYRHMKTSKSVSCAARALLNVYREVHPELLHKSVRGKAAAIAVHQGTAGRVRQFGDMADVAQDVEGIELLEAARKRMRKGGMEEEEEVVEEESEFDDEEDEIDEDEIDEDEIDEDEIDEDEIDEDEIDEDEDEDEESDSEIEQSKVPLAAERVLSNEDFKRIKKLQAVVAEKGSIDSDALLSEDDDDEDEQVVEQDWILNPEKYGHIQGKKAAADKYKAAEERKQAFLMSKETRRGGLTNKEKKRMKPLMMSVQKEVKKKRGMSAAQKFKQAKLHVSNLKKQVGPQKRRRSGKFRK